jgi:hypothetical protein
MNFLTLRGRLRLLIIDWSAVAKGILRRFIAALDRSVRPTNQPLGVLISEMHQTSYKLRNASNPEDRNGGYAAWDVLKVA